MYGRSRGAYYASGALQRELISVTDVGHRFDLDPITDLSLYSRRRYLDNKTRERVNNALHQLETRTQTWEERVIEQSSRGYCSWLKEQYVNKALNSSAEHS